ncbi:MAG TPA: phosphatidylglycerophosphatase A [Sedimentisphaerales bacterium]|nr:phosphatidylglycerophosphatase A [Sedimentisphaerales bacterium]
MNIRRLLTSCFGLGFMPIASGTWGSVPGVILFMVLGYLGLSVVWISAVMLIVVLAASAVCVKFTPAVMKITGKTDPGEIVADEVAGQCMTFVGLAVSATSNICIAAVIGFLLFRFFDITKIWPIRKLEQLPAGWGVLCDDLLAGVFAAVVLQVVVRLADII